MKKIIKLVISFSLIMFLTMVPKTHAYTISGQAKTYYNQSTDNIGSSDVVDIESTYIEYMYYNLGSNSAISRDTIRVVFSDKITTTLLPIFTTLSPNSTYLVEVFIYDNNNNLKGYNDIEYYDLRSMSYFETNFRIDDSINIETIHIKISNIDMGYDEEKLHYIMQSAIIVSGNAQIINQTIDSTSYNNGWNQAMNSKVTQIWSIWGNIFDTFMGVFDVFSIQLVGDITIGHLALVPLVLGLIGFIYALGGKRGR